MMIFMALLLFVGLELGMETTRPIFTTAPTTTAPTTVMPTTQAPTSVDPTSVQNWEEAEGPFGPPSDRIGTGVRFGHSPRWDEEVTDFAVVGGPDDYQEEPYDNFVGAGWSINVNGIGSKFNGYSQAEPNKKIQLCEAIDVNDGKIACGAVKDDYYTGSVFVFERGTGITVPNTNDGSNIIRYAGSNSFGKAVVMRNGYLVVGQAHNLPVNQGRVHIYSTTDWSLLQTLDAPETLEKFGWGLGLSKNASWLVVGSPAFDSNRGRLTFFELSEGNYELRQRLNSTIANGLIGRNLTMSSSGQCGLSANMHLDDQGFVQMFNLVGGLWEMGHRFDNPSEFPGFGQGFDVDSSCTLVVICVRAGCYTYRLSGETWSETGVFASGYSGGTTMIDMRDDASKLMMGNDAAQTVKFFDPVYA